MRDPNNVCVTGHICLLVRDLVLPPSERVLEAEEGVHNPSGVESEGALLEHHDVWDLVALPRITNTQVHVREGDADGLHTQGGERLRPSSMTSRSAWMLELAHA